MSNIEKAEPPTKIEEIDTSNRFLVGSKAGGEKIAIMVLHVEISKEQALNLAAYLVAISDISPDHREFKRYLDAIEGA